MHHLSKIAVRVSMEVTRRFFTKPTSFQQQYKSQESIYSISQGLTSATVEVFGNTVILLSEMALLLGLITIMAYSNWILTIINIVLFGFGLGLLHKIIGKRIYDNSNERIRSVLASNSILLDMIDAYRELVIYKKMDFFITEFLIFKKLESKTASKGTVLNILPKYVFEVIFYIISGVVLLFLYLFSDPTRAFSLFVLFIATGSRVLPSILRIQSALSGIRASQPLGDRSFGLIKDLNMEEVSSFHYDYYGSKLPYKHLFEIKSLKFNYPNKPEWQLEIDNLTIKRNLKIAIVGPSGSGKSTFIDLLLGLLQPTEGEILFSNAEKFNNHSKYLNRVSYVPQQIAILNRTIKENIAIGCTVDEIDEKKVMQCLEKAGLLNFVASLANGINEVLNEKGSNLSGGQKQRLGFARALYFDPNVLFLDESTSSLDSESELNISKAIANLESDVTVISIAHRLSTIKNFDLIIYMENGRISEIGTFKELRDKSTSFNLQAKLMEL